MPIHPELLHARTNCYTLERIATRSKADGTNKMMEIWRLNRYFFFVPGQLEETDQVVARVGLQPSGTKREVQRGMDASADPPRIEQPVQYPP